MINLFTLKYTTEARIGDRGKGGKNSYNIDNEGEKGGPVIESRERNRYHVFTNLLDLSKFIF